MPDVAVVITTFNRHEALARCLAALTRQTVTPDEVIVVDDGSATPVESRLPECLRVLPLRVLRCDQNGGPARGRNLGVGAANARLIVFLDDDVVADQGLIACHTAAHEAGTNLAVIGPLVAPKDWGPTSWNLWEARGLAVEYDRMKIGVYAPTWRQFFTGNASVLRDNFIEAGGFDETFTRAEDIELGIRLHRLGCRFVFEDRAIGWHYATRSRQSWMRIPADYAWFDVMIDRIHPDLGWLEVVTSELGARHVVIGAARKMLHPWKAERPVARLAVWSATGLFRARLTRPALAGLSLAFSLQYSAALADATATLHGHASESPRGMAQNRRT
jgi:GT2 family glycosyltransferase